MVAYLNGFWYEKDEINWSNMTISEQYVHILNSTKEKIKKFLKVIFSDGISTKIKFNMMKIMISIYQNPIGTLLTIEPLWAIK